MIDALLHVLVLLLGFLLLLAVRKVTVIHRPTRQTSIGREHAEACQWLQHLFDGCFDVFREVFADTACRELQDKVDAFLEDGGYAVHASFVVKSIGERPPHIVAVRASTTTTGARQQQAHSTTSTASSSSGGIPGSSSPSTAHGGGGGTSLGSSPDLGPQAAPTQPSNGVMPTPISPALLHASSAAYATGSGGALPPSLATGPLELEVEVEYSGGASLCLHADVPILRGRQLPLSVTVSNLVVRAHCKLILRPCDGGSYGGSGGAGSMPSGATTTSSANPSFDASLVGGGDGGPPTPTVVSAAPSSSARPSSSGAASDAMGFDLFVQAVSEPAFQFTLDTSITKYGITNFFGFALLAKYMLLHVIQTKLMKGVSMRVPLPSEWSRHHHYHNTAVATTRPKQQQQQQYHHKRGHTPPPPLPPLNALGRSLEAVFTEHGGGGGA